MRLLFPSLVALAGLAALAGTVLLDGPASDRGEGQRADACRQVSAERSECSAGEHLPAAARLDSAAVPPMPGPGRPLRVCADPNNLPFSNAAGEGFENRLAEIVAESLGTRVEYTWWAQRRGFLRNTLKAGACDLVAGVPSALDMVLTTAPYYRSIYVFVTASDRVLDIRSLDDARLRDLRVGVQLVGDDGANTPPAHALARRGIVRNVVGFMLYGDYREPAPPSRIVRAVAEGEVDVAVVWGPLAGYFATRVGRPLAVVPVEPQIDDPFLPFVFDISMGVRRGEEAFRTKLDDILDARRADIARLLADFGVPRLDHVASAMSPNSQPRKAVVERLPEPIAQNGVAAMLAAGGAR